MTANAGSINRSHLTTWFNRSVRGTCGTPDVAPPVLSNLPGDITAEATGPTGAVVTWPAVTAADAVDGPVAVSCSPASGSVFRLGTTTVTCVAYGGLGNQATSPFNVTVVDTKPPLAALDALPPYTAVSSVAISGAVSDSGSGVASVQAVVQNGAANLVFGPLAVDDQGRVAGVIGLTEGANQVVLDVTDVAGNETASAARTVVLDTVAPGVTILSPADGSSIGGTMVQIGFSVADQTATVVTVGGQTLFLPPGGATSQSVTIRGPRAGLEHHRHLGPGRRRQRRWGRHARSRRSERPHARHRHHERERVRSAARQQPGVRADGRRRRRDDGHDVLRRLVLAAASGRRPARRGPSHERGQRARVHRDQRSGTNLGAVADRHLRRDPTSGQHRQSRCGFVRTGDCPALGVATDDLTGVASVSFQVDGRAAVPAALSSGGAWVATTSLDSTTLTDGAHTVTATLRDGVGNQRAVIGAFAVDNTPPTVGITSPTAGAFVSRTITVEATAADATSGVASILIDVAGQHVAQCPSAPCSAIFDTTTVSDGPLAIVATAIDHAGGSSAPTQVIVNTLNSQPRNFLVAPPRARLSRRQ